MTISGSARLAGVIGWPVAHSLSPALHNFWIREHHVDAAYVPLGVRPEDFSVAVTGLCLAGFRGINVTIPHKESAFAVAARVDEAARIVGAVNLLLFDGRTFEGRNTDAAGIAASLDESLGEGSVAGRPVVVWGAGGAARAAVYAAAQMGASEIRILNRTPTRAQTLAAALSPVLRRPIAGMGYDRWPQAGKDVAVLIHTTSAGMKGVPSIDLALDVLPGDAAVFDAVYTPLHTDLLARAAARGLKTVDGLGMLMHQAVPSFAAFYGIVPKVTPGLRSVLEKALAGG
jgi:shikimate dehydrogenase